MVININCDVAWFAKLMVYINHILKRYSISWILVIKITRIYDLIICYSRHDSTRRLLNRYTLLNVYQQLKTIVPKHNGAQ